MDKKVQACKASQICLACGREKFSPEHYKICKGKDNPYYCKECKMNNAFCKHTPAMVVERNLRGMGDQAVFEEEEVTIINPDTGQSAKVHAVYDSCDSNLECSLATAKKLGLKLSPKQITINNFGVSRTEKGFSGHIEVVDCLGNKHSEEVLVTDSLRYTIPAVKFDHLPDDIGKVCLEETKTRDKGRVRKIKMEI